MGAVTTWIEANKRNCARIEFNSARSNSTVVAPSGEKHGKAPSGYNNESAQYFDPEEFDGA